MNFTHSRAHDGTMSGGWRAGAETQCAGQSCCLNSLVCDRDRDDDWKKRMLRVSEDRHTACFHPACILADSE